MGTTHLTLVTVGSIPLPLAALAGGGPKQSRRRFGGNGLASNPSPMMCAPVQAAFGR